MVAGFSHSLCCANWRCVCGCGALCCRGCLLPSAERRALDLSPLWACGRPGPRPAGNNKIPPKAPQGNLKGVVVLNTYTVTGLEVSEDGDAVCSRSWVCPNTWLCVSDKSAGRGDGKSPVGGSQDRSPLLAYSSSIWVAARLRAWENTSMNWLSTSLIQQSPLN